MKVKGFVLALALFMTAVGCGGSGGGSSTAINLRTVMLVRGSTSVTVSGSQSGNVDTTLSFPSFTGFAGYSTTVQSFTATDVGVSPNIALGTIAETTATPNAFYTLYVTGVEGSTTFPPTVKLVQETPPVATSTNAEIRYCNFSTSLNQSVDVYVTLASSTSPLSSQTPTFTAVAYGQVSSYAAVAGGSYIITVTATGNSASVLYTGTATTFNGGLVYTNYGSDTSATSATLYTQQDDYLTLVPANILHPRS